MQPKTRTPATLPCGRPTPVHETSGKANARDSWKSRLKEHLDETGLKHSEQRDKIVELILSEDRHFRAQDMVRKVQAKYPSIGAATVYRNLKLLHEAGILKESLVEGGQAVYELSEEDHHDHIVCLDCNAILEFHDEAIEELQEKASKKLGFKQASHRHVIYGNCEYFRKSGTR